MKAVERKLNKAQLATIWLLIISVLLAAAYITVIAVVNKLASNSTGSSNSNTLDILEGEAIYANNRVAYPYIPESKITYVEVKSPDGTFGISRYPDDKGSFVFHYYVDGQEGAITYTPPICTAETTFNNFNYESLYAAETSGFYRYYIDYLCMAIGTVYFTERIELPSADTEEGAAKREALLRGYGISQSESTMISFMYGERDEKTGDIIKDTEEARVLVVGNKAISGNGYYYMVSGRDYVYYTSSEEFSYALAGFNQFVNGRLVAAGLSDESVYGPYLTSDFKEWKTSVYKSTTDKVFTNDQLEYKNFENPTVVVNGGYKVSVDKGLDFVPDVGGFSGYNSTEKDRFSFNLEVLKDHPDYARIKNALVDKSVGTYDEKIVFTLVNELYMSNDKQVEFGENESVKYEYLITKIESVVTDNGEITEGTVGESDTLLKVTYRYTVGGQTVKHDCHAVVDITDFGDDKEKFKGVAIGKDLGEDAIAVAVDYTKDNSLELSEKYVLTGITAIYDEYGGIADTVTEKTYVSITYTITVGGKKVTDGTAIIRLADIKDDDKLAPLKTSLPGKGKGSYTEVIYNREFYYEFMRDFATYEISEIEYFTANELVVSFRFSNASKRDPYYGETFFTNTLSNEYKLYGLNDGACLAVVKLLGGVGTDSNSAVGLSGKTVAVGLSLENIEKYGLYANKIYFEMPRGIEDPSTGEEEDNDRLSDFIWKYTLGFTLYISDVEYDEDGTKIRYIGSDMYDVIAKVPAEDFEFLNYEFTEFWARKHLVMMDITKIESLRLEFNMENFKSEYDFELKFEDKYGAYINGEFVVSDEKFDGSNPIEEYQTVMLKVSGSSSDDAYKTLFEELNGTEWRNLTTVYKETMGSETYPSSKTNYGAAYFNAAYETLQLTRYFDDLTEDEQAIGFTKTRVMRMHLQVQGKDDYYTYDFYRIDDRRVMVCLYRSDKDGNKIESYGQVSDYYLTTFAFKKLVNNYLYLLNGKHVDETINYN